MPIESHSIKQRLRELAVAMTVVGGPTVAGHAAGFGQTHRLLSEVSNALAHGDDPRRADSVKSLQSEVEEFAAMVDRLANVPICAQHGRVFVIGDSPEAAGQLISSVTLHVTGIYGSAEASFVSGSSLNDVAKAIGTMVQQTGVEAQIAPTNPLRLELRSLWNGSKGFVSVTQEGGNLPVLADVANGGTPEFAVADFGADQMPGDVNCDWAVDAGDLAQIVLSWGPCTLPVGACVTDLDHNGVVDIDDLVIVITNWGLAE